MCEIIIDKRVFKQVSINHNYYIDCDGNVYSKFAKKIIKTLYRNINNKCYAYVDMFVAGKQKHINIHRLVYTAWVGEIQEGMQINHKDDNSLNNNYLNLYAGTQKDNIRDCITNKHRVGGMYYLTIFDKKTDEVLTFCPANKFIEYCKHSCANGCIKRFFKRNWFKKRYEILEYKRIDNLSHFKSVTTMTDECRSVD